jgi:hypothetical protein
MTTSLGCMVQQGIDEECGMMNTRRVVALSDVEGRPSKVSVLISC